jgi:hypothetical protein
MFRAYESLPPDRLMGRNRVQQALLRLLDSWHAEVATEGLNQIAKASSSNAMASRRVIGSSTASS